MRANAKVAVVRPVPLDNKLTELNTCMVTLVGRYLPVWQRLIDPYVICFRFYHAAKRIARRFEGTQCACIAIISRFVVDMVPLVESTCSMMHKARHLRRRLMTNVKPASKKTAPVPRF